MLKLRRLTELWAAVATLRIAARIARLRQFWRPRWRRWLRYGLVPLLSMALIGAPLEAQNPPPPLPQRFSDEFQVDGDADSGFPTVAMSHDGAFAVAWADQNNSEIYINLYDAVGQRRTGPLSLHATTASEARIGNPAIAMDADGDFVVTWQLYGYNLNPSSYYEATIFAQRFDATGNQLDPRIRVTSMSTEGLGAPSVAMDAEGGFAVTWGNWNEYTAEVKRYDATGAALPSLPALNNSASFNQPRLAMDAAGNFVVAWSQADDIYAARYDRTNGSFMSLNNAEPLNPVRSDSFFYNRPDVAMDAAGNFAVVWDASENGSQRVLGQRFSPTGQPLDQFVVDGENQSSSGPSAAMLEDALLAVSWDVPVDEDTRDIRLAFLRPASSIATPVASETVNANFNLRATAPDVAASPLGSLVVVWQARSSQPFEDWYYNLYARLYASPISYNVTTSTASVTERSDQQVSFTITRTGAVGGRGSVAYRFGGTAGFGSDYVISGGSADVQAQEGVLNFVPGQRSQTITLGIIDDTLGEPNKSIMLELREPWPSRIAQISFPIAVVTLADDDLAEVRIQQSNGSTIVGAGLSDELTLALRTIPTAPVTLTLTPNLSQLNLGAGWGSPQQLFFQPDASAMQPQTVQVSLLGAQAAAALAVGTTISFSAQSADPAYDRGARFTVDGFDQSELPVRLLGEVPPSFVVFLPLTQR